MTDSHKSPSEHSAGWLMATLLGCLAVLVALGLSMLVAFQRMQPRAENLHIAAIHWPEDIPKLLARGDDINQQDADGNTPLHLATTFRKPESVRLLLDAGADPNIADTQGETPLLSATFMPGPAASTQITLMLLKAGADPNVHSIHADQTPLHRVASERLAPLTRALLDAGANPNARQILDETPLHVASTSDVARLLIDAGADLEAREHNGNTPIHLAVARHLHDVVKVLLAAGASAEAENNYGMKPVDQRQGDERMAALFNSAGMSSPTE